MYTPTKSERRDVAMIYELAYSSIDKIAELEECQNFMDLQDLCARYAKTQCAIQMLLYGEHEASGL